MAQEQREQASDNAGDAAGTPPPARSPSDVRKNRPRRWHERTSVTLSVAAAMVVLALGFVHIITGVVSPLNLPFDIMWKESFGYRETFVNAPRIQALPYLAAKIKYPLGCKALQRRDYLPSGREFEARQMGRQRENLSRWQSEFERSLPPSQVSWQDPLQGAPAAPEDPNAANQKGIAFADEGRYEAAIAQFTRAIQRNPAFVEAWANRARVYIAIGNLGQAVSDFSQIVEIRPECVEARRQCGRLHLAMSRYDEAISDFEKIVELDPRHAEAHFLLALACYAKGQYARAWECLDRLQALGRGGPTGFVVALHEASGHGGPRERVHSRH
jgi:regulator of sirC expression with transglutaminase-like and TPR domain